LFDRNRSRFSEQENSVFILSLLPKGDVCYPVILDEGQAEQNEKMSGKSPKLLNDFTILKSLSFK
jgi:hypothetical protein